MNMSVSLPNFEGISKPFDHQAEAVMSKYSKLANYLVDDGYVAKMTGNELKVYVVVNRFTEGFSRKNWSLSSTYLQEKTGIKSEETLSKSIRALEKLGLIKVLRVMGEMNRFSICHPKCFGVSPINMTTPKDLEGSTPKNSGESTPKNSGESTPKNSGSKKENIKENIKESIYVQIAHEQTKIDQAIEDQKTLVEQQKIEQLEKQKAKAELENQVEQNFEIFWKAYPNKKSKKPAFEKFKRIDFKKHSFEQIMSALEKQKQSFDWLKNNGQYVPMPQTWIFNERWTDEIQVNNAVNTHTDVNALWAEKLEQQSIPENFVPTLVLGEEFN